MKYLFKTKLNFSRQQKQRIVERVRKGLIDM